MTQPHFDWRLAQELLGWGRTPAPNVPVALIRNGCVTALFRVGPNARREWVGATEKEFRARWPDALLFQETEWDKTFREPSRNRENLRELTRRAAQGLDRGLKKEFQSWIAQDRWFESLLSHPFLRKVLPARFGLLVRLDDRQDFYLRVEANRVVSLESIDEHKNPSTEIRIKVLQDRDGVPVQGVSLAQSVWDEIRTSAQPWKRLQTGLWRQEIEFFPKRRGMRFYVFARSISILAKR